jgi:hypothetical protein
MGQRHEDTEEDESIEDKRSRKCVRKDEASVMKKLI